MHSRDLSNLLWCDLVSDTERVKFIRSGRACDTGIMALAISEDVALAFEAKIELERHKANCHEQDK